MIPNPKVTIKNTLDELSEFECGQKIKVTVVGHIDTWQRQDDHAREKGKCNMYENPFGFIIIKYDNWDREKFIPGRKPRLKNIDL